MFRKILIVNRGEIALRVMRTCREMGIQTVAVYSDADRTAPHVLFADEAYHLGPAPSNQSYLKQEKLLEVLKASGADAVHPGYGFLSENTAFAAAVIKAGATFIGPPAPAITLMGDKTAARQQMIKAGVPVVPGTEEPIEDVSEARRIAEKIGLPVLVKAAGGGGGKGMRLVHKASEFEKTVAQAQREAASAFGDGRVYIEKYLEEPHHIEFQILADEHGHVIHLNERECSIQRRYQKVVEESPSPFLTPEIREKMGQAAVEAARSCGYTNAGTVEFLVDKHRNFYFLEMNTRLQVEHPVTEMVTQIDLVAEQLKIACGEPLSLTQKDVRSTGHAIECRIYAEDARMDFAPSTGVIQALFIPNGFGTRFDGAIQTGCEITPFYDPMLGKLVTWGNDRETALDRMHRALSEFLVAGIETSIGFCDAVVQHPTFRSGQYDTHFYEMYKSDLLATLNDLTPEAARAAALTAAAHQLRQAANGRLISKNKNKQPMNRWLQIRRGEQLQ
ncbi:MAG: acetyl-CoA carboxylase biotin carboxylase subunit [Lentisphaeria bacterium]|nr:acetyl-CoA carboxylase biotin carboxylase subunit [Candidatus Neomarinimicrobiota bacterium]MCF7841423.1 acetyl-CoA carboxylase biotin carboxylase subunit [Lentisphaeria bacterium]